MLRSRVSTTEFTMRCERKTRKNGLVEVSFWPLIFSSVQNLTFYGLKKNINVFSHRLMLKIELKKFFSWLNQQNRNQTEMIITLQLNKSKSLQSMVSFREIHVPRDYFVCFKYYMKQSRHFHKVPRDKFVQRSHQN